MNKNIYYYNKKYPEYGYREIIVLDELRLKNNDGSEDTLQYLVTDWNIDYEMYDEPYDGLFHKQISVYSPYNDEEIYVHDLPFNNHLIFSYNKNKLKEWLKSDIEEYEKNLRKRLSMIMRIKEKDGEYEI